MAKRRRIRWDRVFAVFGPPVLLIMICCVCCNRKEDTPDMADSSVADSMMTEPLTTDVTDTTTPVEPAEEIPDHILVVLDAGHGGNDGGATNNEITRFEKDDNLRLTLAVRDKLKSYPHIETLLTREEDVFVSLKERCEIANNANADLFISFHRNSAASGHGVEIWINNDADYPNSLDKKLATYIIEALDDIRVSKNRGVQSGFRNTFSNNESDNYYVNRYTDMPSCLIEMGFMTSDLDNAYFDERIDGYADAIAHAIYQLAGDRRMIPSDTPS